MTERRTHTAHTPTTRFQLTLHTSAQGSHWQVEASAENTCYYMLLFGLQNATTTFLRFSKNDIKPLVGFTQLSQIGKKKSELLENERIIRQSYHVERVAWTCFHSDTRQRITGLRDRHRKNLSHSERSSTGPDLIL